MPPIQTVNGVTMNAQGPSQPAVRNPWEGKDPAKAAAWATLTPEDQKWLGGADPTDKFILYRAPNKGTPAPTPAAEPESAVATPVAPQTDVQAAPIPAAADATADNSGAPPTATTDFDSMPFGKAFQTARAQGLKQFNWKGKPYSTELAKPASNQSGMSANVAPAGQPPATASKPSLGTVKGATQAIPTTPAPAGNAGGAGKNATFNASELAAAREALKDPKLGAKDRAYYTDMLARQPKSESIERLVSLVHYR